MLAVSAAILLAILIIVLLNPLRVNRDASLHLLIGQLLLRGAVPYVDFVEINPPLVYYLHVIPVALANWLAINPIPVFLLLMLALSIWAIGVCMYLTSTNIPTGGALIGAVVAVSVSVLNLKLFTTNEFGEREHIFLLLVLPYVMLRWLRWRGRLTDGRRLGLVVGLAAGLGAYIKPHFLLILVALELFWRVAEARSWAWKEAELLSVLGVGLAYGVFLLLIPAEMRRGLIMVVESVLSGGYRAYGDMNVLGLILDQNVLLLVGLLPFLFFRTRKNADDAESLLLTMCIFLLASLVVYGSQARGFAYHLIPAMGAEYVVIFLVIFVIAFRLRPLIWPSSQEETRGERRWRLIGWPLIVTLVLIGVVKGIGDLSPSAIRGAASLADAGIIATIRDNTRRTDAVLVVSTMAEPYRLVLQAGRPLASKYIPTNPISFGVSGIGDTEELYDPTYPLPVGVQAYLDELQMSIARDRPAMLIIDNRVSCVGCPEGFQVSEFLKARGVYNRVISGHYTMLLDAERFWILKRAAGPVGSAG